MTNISNMPLHPIVVLIVTISIHFATGATSGQDFQIKKPAPDPYFSTTNQLLKPIPKKKMAELDSRDERASKGNSIIRQARNSNNTSATVHQDNGFRLASYEEDSKTKTKSTNEEKVSQQRTPRLSDSIQADFAKRPFNMESPKLNLSEKKSDDEQSFQPSQVVAMVGGEPVFVGDILFEANQMIQKFMPTAPESIKNQQRQILIKRLIPKFVEAKLMYVDTVRDLPEQVDVETIIEQAEKDFDDKAMPEMMKRAGVKSPIEFDAQLRGMGSSLRKFRRSWSKDQLVRFFLAKKLKVETEVTHQEMLDYYAENAATYSVKSRARWEELMVRLDKFSSRLEAKKAIIEMGNRVVHGASFAAVARKSSHGFNAEDGGLHDWTNKGSLVAKKLDEAIFELPLNELSDIIESDLGLHIIRVVERTRAGKTPFLEAQVAIKEKLQEEKRNAVFEKHLSQLREQIPVEIFGYSDNQ